MGTNYEQLCMDERCEIARLHANGQTIRQIAADLDRSASTISRELKRNGSGGKGYKPAYADDQAWSRRWRSSRLARQPDLREAVRDLLAMGWSPEQTAARLARQKPSMRISHESIYRFIYAQIRRTKDGDWRRYLPRAKAKRGYRGRKGGSPASFIKDRVSLEKRPAAAANRKQSGHWETDCMLFSHYGQTLLVAQERSSRFVRLAVLPSRQACNTAAQLEAWLRPLPPSLRRTLTQDNGTEFADHYKLKASLGVQTFFCDPHSPWQKGGIENANGRLRRWLPRKTDLSACSAEQIQAIADRYNNTPRKCLGFKTPNEVFYAQLLHFKCESTSPPSRG